MNRELNFEPIFLEPIFKERIWGGTALAERFGYKLSSPTTGECWAISGHPHGESIVKNGAFKGWTLGRLWKEKRQLFGNYPSETFPLLTKILDANADLSVQVHPDDEYARVHENGERGKTECWYIIDCKEDAEIVYGHHAKTKEELIEMIRRGEWNRLLRRVKIKPGDFFYVPSGTIHALCAGTLVLETQQSSDTTYRVYDYDRRDENGNLRELHIDKALDVISVPHRDAQFQPRTEIREGAKITTFIEGEYFTVYKWEVDGSCEMAQNRHFLLASVLSGDGEIESEQGAYPFRKGDHFILPHGFGRFKLKGQAVLIVSHP